MPNLNFERLQLSWDKGEGSGDPVAFGKSCRQTLWRKSDLLCIWRSNCPKGRKGSFKPGTSGLRSRDQVYIPWLFIVNTPKTQQDTTRLINISKIPRSSISFGNSIVQLSFRFVRLQRKQEAVELCYLYNHNMISIPTFTLLSDRSELRGAELRLIWYKKNLSISPICIELARNLRKNWVEFKLGRTCEEKIFFLPFYDLLY